MTDASNESSERAPRVLILAGTTAVGKTDVSIPLAELLEGEIISADSRQIYRELEIGTAKPDAAQRARVTHHFIDEKGIRERWTSGDFGRASRQRIDDILARERTPIVVGGSMLYLRALMDGFFEDEEILQADYVSLRTEMGERGIAAMYAELQERDPQLARRTDPADHHRILRGLAVHRQQSKRLSQLQEQPAPPLGHPFRLYFLYGEREQTYERANARALMMVESGLVDEVRGLWEQGFDESNCNALRTHGYQEVFPYLRGEISREQMIEYIQKAVRHYIKRQVTWFRHDSRAIWIQRDFEIPAENVARRIHEDFTSD